MSDRPARALVLGGGGLAGIAWEIGLLAALAGQGVDVASADLVVGTSAGSVVGALLRSGADLDALYAAQLAPPPATERAGRLDLGAMVGALGAAVTGASGPQDARARVGAWARSATDVPEAERLAVIAARLPVHEWPQGRLVITAVDTADGALLTLDRDAGVPLVEAVAASCAVPGTWPTVTLSAGPHAGARCMDGGIRSVTNADLARGAERVLVVAPFSGFPQPLRPSLAQETAELERTGRVVVVAADARSTAAFGANPLDPATRGPSAEAGRAQAAAVLDAVRELWA